MKENCMKCNEEVDVALHGFKVYGDDEEERLYTGHKDCMVEMSLDMQNMKNKQYSRVIKSNLPFSKAFDALNKRGKMITRAIWDGYWYKELIMFNGNEEQGDVYEANHGRSIIMAKLKSGEFAPASPYQDDLLAEDWMIVE